MSLRADRALIHISIALSSGGRFERDIQPGSLTCICDPAGSAVGREILDTIAGESEYRLAALSALSGERVALPERPRNIRVHNLPPVKSVEVDRSDPNSTLLNLAVGIQPLQQLVQLFGMLDCGNCGALIKPIAAPLWLDHAGLVLNQFKDSLLSISLSLPNGDRSSRELLQKGMIAAIRRDRIEEMSMLRAEEISSWVIEKATGRELLGKLPLLIQKALLAEASGMWIHLITPENKIQKRLLIISSKGICERCFRPASEELPKLTLENKLLSAESSALNIRLGSKITSEFEIPTIRKMLSTPCAEISSVFLNDPTVVRSEPFKQIESACATLTKLGLGYLPLMHRRSEMSFGECFRSVLAEESQTPLSGFLFEASDPALGPEEGSRLLNALRELNRKGTVIFLTPHQPPEEAVEILRLNKLPEAAPEPLKVADSERISVPLPFLDKPLELKLGSANIVWGDSGSGKSRILSSLEAVLKGEYRGVKFDGVYSSYPAFSKRSITVLQVLEFLKPLAALLAKTEAARLLGAEETFLASVLNGRTAMKDELQSIAFKGRSIPGFLTESIEGLSDLLKTFPKGREKIDFAERVGISKLRLGQKLDELGHGERQKLLFIAAVSGKKSRSIFLLDDFGRFHGDLGSSIAIINEKVSSGATVIAASANPRFKTRDACLIRGYGYPRRTTFDS